MQGCGLEIAQLFQPGENAVGALCDGLFVGLEDEFGRLRLLVGVVDAGEVGNFACVGEFVEALDVALAADLDGTFDVDLDEMADFLARPVACFPVGGDGGGDANHTITCEEGAHEGDASDVGVAVCAAEAKTFAQVGTYDIAIKDLYVASTGSQSLFYGLSKGALASAGKACEPDGYAFMCHTGWFSFLELVVILLWHRKDELGGWRV